ncbi:MAG: hypothetical protein KBB65_06525 [Syntrophorhabdaceae bacterium]|nr:hypothetical protein [Syntrophorhabdaceae bacterium]
MMTSVNAEKHCTSLPIRVPAAFFSCLLIFLFLASTDPAYAADNEVHFSNEFSYTYNDITGPGGDDSSSLTRGFRYLNIFGFMGNGTVRELEYNFNLGFKATDDRRNDVATFSPTNIQGRMTNKIHTVNAGDTFESFSQYSLSTAVKGASYRYFNEQKNSPEITMVYGYVLPRWDTIWGGIETRAIERTAYGMRIKQNFSPNIWAGISYVQAKDRPGTRIMSTDPIYDSNNYTVDAEYKPIPGLAFRGEFSTSRTTMSPSSLGGQNEDRTHGTASRIEAVGEGGPSRVSLEYERVSTEFQSILGSATPDREKIKSKWRYTMTKNIMLNLGLLWFRDNLDGQKAYRTDSYTPEVGFTFKNLLGRQSATADLAYRYDRKFGAGNGSGISTADHMTTLNYRDRFGPVDSDANVGYTIYSTERDQRQAKEYTYNLSLNSRHEIGEAYVVKPVVYLGGMTSRDDLALETDRIYEYSFGMGFELLKLKLNSDFRIGQNVLEKTAAGTDNSTKTFGSFNVYYRPPFLKKFNEGMLYLRSFVNDFRFSTQSRSFRENSVTLGVNLQY